MSSRGLTMGKKGMSTSKSLIGISLFIIGFVSLIVYLVPVLFPVKYVSKQESNEAAIKQASIVVASTTSPVRIVKHLKPPVPLKAIYMTSWVAGSPSIREGLIKLIDETEINAVVIDIKDYTGRISFLTDDPEINETGAPHRRIGDIEALIDLLHEKNIYVIGRISVFQDSHMVALHPEWAVKRTSDGGVWKDYKGISWIDVSAKPFWDYILDVSKYSFYEAGFDELNFDYIRFPSDGNMKDIAYPFTGTLKKPEALKNFFAYLHENLKPATTTQDTRGKEYPIMSADLFGMTTTNKDDLNIGQVLENTFPYFDYVAPMVYPSHYPTNFNGYSNPSAMPYEVIEYSMSRAVDRAIAASTTPAKLRPWLQDFSIGTTRYTPEMVRAQIQATYDVGLDSWMLWNAANKYSASALEKEFSTSSY